MREAEQVRDGRAGAGEPSTPGSETERFRAIVDVRHNEAVDRRVRRPRESAGPRASLPEALARRVLVGRAPTEYPAPVSSRRRSVMGLIAVAITMIALAITATSACAATTRPKYVTQVDQVCSPSPQSSGRLGPSLKELFNPNAQSPLPPPGAPEPTDKQIHRSLNRFINRAHASTRGFQSSVRSTTEQLACYSSRARRRTRGRPVDSRTAPTRDLHGGEPSRAASSHASRGTGFPGAGHRRPDLRHARRCRALASASAPPRSHRCPSLPSRVVSGCSPCLANAHQRASTQSWGSSS